MPSVDDVLRHAFESTDDDWGRLAPAAHSAVMARHRRAQRVRRGLAVAAVAATSAAVVVVLSTGDVRNSSGVEPADQTPTTTTPALSTPLEGRWTSGPLDASDVRAAARAAGAPRAAAAMLAQLPQAPFTVVLSVRGASLSTYVEGADGRREVLDQESIAVEGGLVTVRALNISAETVHEWSLDGDVLTLAFGTTTEPENDGVPGEAWQRLLYDSASFTR